LINSGVEKIIALEVLSFIESCVVILAFMLLKIILVQVTRFSDLWYILTPSKLNFNTTVPEFNNEISLKIFYKNNNK